MIWNRNRSPGVTRLGLDFDERQGFDLELSQKEDNKSVKLEQRMPFGDCSMEKSIPPMPVEIICERAHSVIYEYAIVTVKFIADEFKGLIKVEQSESKNLLFYRQSDQWLGCIKFCCPS